MASEVATKCACGASSWLSVSEKCNVFRTNTTIIRGIIVTYHLRPATSANHFSDIIVLDRQCFPTDVTIEPEKGHYWILWADGAPIGYTGIVMAKRDPGTAVRTRSCVLRGYRGKGLQRRLIRVTQRWARRERLECVLATTASWNSSSANNFIRTGWRVYNPKNHWMEAGTIYWRWLAKWPMRSW